MENNELTSTQSIEIIKGMIAQTRTKLERGGGNLFLIWGYTSLAVTAAVYTMLLLTMDIRWAYGWMAIVVIGYPLQMLVQRGHKDEPTVTTYIDRFVGRLWIVLTVVLVLTPLVSGSPLTLAIEGLIISIGVVLTGLTISFRALTVGGIIGGLISYALFIFGGFEVQIPLFAALFVVMMIIPGHVLNSSAKKSMQCSKS